MRASIVLVLAACGSTPQIKESTETEPTWAKDFAAATARACACRDDACIRAARPELDAILDAHGGIEEAPPSVHEHKQEFEACWLATSQDLARDLGASADEICGCDTVYCLGTWWEHIQKLSIRYGTSDPNELRHTGDAAASAAWERAARCLQAVTIPAADYLAILQRTNAELCACTLPECGKDALAKHEAAVGKYLVVDPDAVTTGLTEARAQYCKCAKKFPPTYEVDTETRIADTPVHITGQIYVHADCGEAL